MAKTISELRTLSEQIQTANEGENTRERVGGLFEDIVDYLDDNPGGGGSVSLNQPLSAINNAGLGNPNNGQTLIYSNGRWTYGTPGGGGGGGTGTLSSVGLNMPTGFSVANSPLTSDGSIIVNFATGYSLLSSTLKDNWNAATDKINNTTWWGHTIQNNAVTGNLSGNIGYIEFSNGVRIGVDTESNTLKVYTSGGSSASFYSTGALSALGSSSGGGTVTQYLRDLLDVEINNNSLANGDALLWDSSKSKWVNGVVSGGGGVTLGALLTSLNTMNNPTSSQSGYGLVWNGSTWTFAEITGGGGSSVVLNNLVSSLNNSSLNAPTNSEIGKGLVWSASGWAYKDIPTVYSWAQAATKPTYTWTEITQKPSWIGDTPPAIAFTDISGVIATSQLPRLYWADVEVSATSSTTTSPTFLGINIDDSNNPGYINFFKNGTLNNYTVRLEESTAGILKLYGKLQIGNGVIEWDNTNNSFKLTGGLYTDSFLTALGIASSSSIYSISGLRQFTDGISVGSSSSTYPNGLTITQGTATISSQSETGIVFGTDTLILGTGSYLSFFKSDDVGLTIGYNSGDITLENDVNISGSLTMNNSNINDVNELSATNINVGKSSNYYLHKNGNDLYWYANGTDIKIS